MVFETGDCSLPVIFNNSHEINQKNKTDPEMVFLIHGHCAEVLNSMQSLQ